MVIDREPQLRVVPKRELHPQLGQFNCILLWLRPPDPHLPCTLCNLLLLTTTTTTTFLSHILHIHIRGDYYYYCYYATTTPYDRDDDYLVTLPEHGVYHLPL